MDYLASLCECFFSFCNCLQCSEDVSIEGHEPNERSHLLLEPSLVRSNPALRCNSDNLSNDFSNSLPRKDDQSALSRLVQNTSINMIDVGATDLHNLENQEYNDRIKLYSQRLQQQWSDIQYSVKSSTGLLKDVPNMKDYVVKEPDMEDIRQMKVALEEWKLSLLSVKIDPGEAIVVSFQIPTS